MAVLVGRNSSALKDLQAAQAAYDRAVAALESAKAQVKVAEADLSSNETELGKAEIRSPIGGIVLSRNVDPGQTVAATLQAPVLFTIAEDLAKMNLLVDIDEADAGSVKEGQDAVFTVEAYPDRKFTARVLQLRYAPETVNGVVTYKAVLSVDNADLSLRPGMTATAEIITRRADGRSPGPQRRAPLRAAGNRGRRHSQFPAAADAASAVVDRRRRARSSPPASGVSMP